jgi:hypothetical protein
VLALQISRANHREHLAFWINLYNVLAAKVVLEHYSVASICNMNIAPGRHQIGSCNTNCFVVEGQEINLIDIKHRALLPI